MTSPIRFVPRRGGLLASEYLLKRGAMAFVLLIIGLVVYAAKFTSLDVNAADYAQIARNLATGHGYSTSAVMPLSLALAPQTGDHSELMRPPAYVTFLALAMLVAGATDKTVAMVSLIFLLLTALALYVIAARCFGRAVALWACPLYFISVPILKQAISGLDTTFLSFLVTLLFGALMWNYRGSEEGDEGQPSSLRVGTPIAAGILLGLCYLTSYDSIVLLPVVLYFLWRVDRRQGRRNAVAVLVPFAILVLPWIVRSSLIVGRPFISLHAYDFAMFTSQYPGQTLLRRFEDVPHYPWLVAMLNSVGLLNKVAQGAGGFYTDASQFAGPYLMPFFIVGLLLAAPRRRWVLLHGCLALALFLQVAVLCFYQPLSRLLLPYSPIVVAVAVYWLLMLLQEWQEALPAVRRRYRRLGVSLEGVGLAILLAAMGIPLLLYLFASGPSRQHPAIDTMRALGTTSYAYVATDLPWLAAWYGGIQTMALPLRDKDWKGLEGAGLAPAAMYLSPALLEAPPTEQMEPYQRALLAGQAYQGMQRDTTWRMAGLLLVRQPRTSPPAAPATPARPVPRGTPTR
jgi:4-amino-4-deoxy-L-arabinose transferase-like glycosyltransferase